MASSDRDSRADRVLSGLASHESQRSDDVVPERYKILEEFGRGGMAVVYRARDEQLGREVAVKVLRDDILADADAQLRFQRESAATAQLKHENIVTVFDAGARYFVMEAVVGRSLAEVLAAARPSFATSATLLAKVARAIEAAHQQGVVHRDLKPSNILIDENGEPRVVDFGVAHLVGDLTVLTRSGVLVGTPRYMAPEQVHTDRQEVSARTDVYALGAILYEAITGVSPHVGDTPLALFAKIVEDDPVPPRKLDPGVPADLETIALKALAKDPRQRYVSAAAFAADLERWSAGEPIEGKRPSLAHQTKRLLLRRRGIVIAAALGVLVLVITLGILLPRLRVSELTADLWRELTGVLRDAEIHARGGDVATARARLARGISVCRAFLREQEVPDARYFLGRLLHEAGDRPAALSELANAIDGDAGLAEAHLERGLILVEEYEALERSLRSVLAGQPLGSVHATKPEALEAMHPRLAALRERAIADLSVEIVDSVYVREVDAIFGGAELARMRWAWEASKKGFETVLQKEPLYARAHLALAKLERDRLNHAEAIRHASAAIAQHRGLSEAYVIRGRAYFWKSEQEGPTRLTKLARANSLADLQRAIEISDSSWSRMARADVDLRMGNRQAAMRGYDEAIRLDPSNAIAHNHRGIGFVQDNRWSEALRDFSAAIRLSPKYGSAWSNRAKVRIALGNESAAKEDAMKALEVTPKGSPQRGAIEQFADFLRRTIK